MSKEYTRLFTTLGLVPISGAVLFHNNFEGLLHFAQAGAEGDYIFELDPSKSYSGSQSLNMKTRTTDAAENDLIRAQILSHVSPAKLISLSTRLLSPNFSRISDLKFDLSFYDGTNLNKATIFYHPATPSLNYHDQNDAPQIIPNSDTFFIDNAWHTLTLRVNFLTNKYISLSLDHLSLDLSSFSFYQTTDPTHAHLLSRIFPITVGANPAQIYLDEFSLTET